MQSNQKIKMNKVYSLGIVQSHLTQFDGPLFRKIAACPDLRLTVYLTRPDGHFTFYDPELHHVSGWDHDITSGYHFETIQNGWWNKLSMAHRIAAAGHDLVIVSGYSSAISLLILLLSKVHGIPVGMRADSVLLYRTKTTWKWRLKDIILPLLYRLFTTMHPVGSLARTTMLSYGFSDQAIFLFPYAVDNDYLRKQYEIITPQRLKLREELGIDSNAYVILGVLKFVPREDPLTLLQAYNHVIESFPNTHLILVGDGDLHNEITAYVLRHKLHQVHLPGYVPYSHLPRYFAVADIFVHPARVEPWGVTVNEALVCGLPVVAAETVGAAYDLIEGRATGLMFRMGDIDALATQLAKLLSDRDQRDRMSQNAIKCISGWSYDLTIEQLRGALQYVASEKVEH